MIVAPTIAITNEYSTTANCSRERCCGDALNGKFFDQICIDYSYTDGPIGKHNNLGSNVAGEEYDAAELGVRLKDPKMSAPSRVWRSRGASKTERHMAFRRLPKQRSAGAPQVYPRSKYIGGSDRACSSTWDNHCASNDEVSNTEYYCIKVVILQRSSGKLVYKFSGEGH